MRGGFRSDEDRQEWYRVGLVPPIGGADNHGYIVVDDSERVHAQAMVCVAESWERVRPVGAFR
ncbi:hypothetical protein GCM10023353_10230 [Tomitella cavernea]|uniref:Uncharacterized protein n=1 Tax=Tomitella cavernea TaxID=1387982 RepID=A0ABP9CGI2_9ACTN